MTTSEGWIVTYWYFTSKAKFLTHWSLIVSHIEKLIHCFNSLFLQIWTEFCCECAGHLFHDWIDDAFVGECCTWCSSHHSFLWWNVHSSLDHRSTGNFCCEILYCNFYSWILMELTTNFSQCSLAKENSTVLNSMLETSEFRFAIFAC